MYGDTDFELTWKEFMAICLCLQLTLPYMIRTVHLVYKWGARTIPCVMASLALYIILHLSSPCDYSLSGYKHLHIDAHLYGPHVHWKLQ